MRLLFLFLDGVGLGEADPQKNPFALAELPELQGLLGGQRLLADSAPLENERATLLALDACLGIEGLPQSASGQATLLTGENIPAALGYHYGPKPNPQVAARIKNGNLFSRLQAGGKCCAFLNAYPQSYFEGIQSGRRLHAAIPLAAASAGLELRTSEHLHAGQALSADFTGLGWRTHLGLADTPIITPKQAGERLDQLARDYDLTFFEYWLSDFAGHRRDLPVACDLLHTFDQVLGGLLESWDDQAGLILLTSDHGNIEDLSTRRHTFNPVPALVIGAPELRKSFVQNLHNLADVAPAIYRLL